MFRSVFNKIYLFGVRIANIGICDELDFSEKKKTQLLNIVIAFGILSNLFFSVVNFLHHKEMLAAINFLLLVGGIAILIINSYRKFLIARLVLTFAASTLFTIMAVLYRNGAEYFLILNLIIVIIYFNEKIYLLSISLVNCSLFIAIKIYLEFGTAYDSVGFGRVVFNIIWMLLGSILALLFFKNELLSYQEEIEQKNRELQKLNDAKEKLFSIISHDLRSPIGQLKNSLEMVNNAYISPEAFQQISVKLSTEVDRLQATLDNLLTWSISQLQGIKAVPQRILLSELLEQKLALFKQVAAKKNISLNLEHTNHYIWADPNHVLVVLRNLISNAIKYSYPDGCICISSYSKDQQVIIRIQDNGMGMNEEVKKAVFNDNNMVSNTGTANEKGTGIGLKLCKEFIEKNEGEIWVESQENKGSTFYISLPEAK